MLCKELSGFSSGDFFVQQGRNGWVVLVEGLSRTVITYCMKLFPIWTSSSGGDVD